MKKATTLVIFVVVLLVVVCMAIAEVTTIPKNANWSTAKPYYEKAIQAGCRIDYSNWAAYDQWEKEIGGNVDELITLTRLWTLGEEGSYTDLVLIGIGRYHELWSAKIQKASNNKARKELFLAEIAGLIDIYKELDRQILMRYKFGDEVDKLFAPFAEASPCLETLLYEERQACREKRWEAFVVKYPQYKAPWPGFFSTQIEVLKDNRTWENYHEYEILALKLLRGQVQKQSSLTVTQYEAFMGDLKKQKSLHLSLSQAYGAS